MSQAFFARDYETFVGYDNIFVQKRDATGKLAIASNLKIAASFRIHAYDIFFNAVYEILRVSKITAEVCMLRFCDAVFIATLGDKYLRAPIDNDLGRISKD